MPTAFGQALGRARRAAGLSQAQLGEPRFTRSYVSLIESGGRAPTPEVIEHVAGKLGLPPEHVRSWALNGDDVVAADAAALQLEAALLMKSGLAERLSELDAEPVAPSPGTQGVGLASFARRAERTDLWWLSAFAALRSAISRRDLDLAVTRCRALLDHDLTRRSQLLEGRVRTRLAVALRLQRRFDEAVQESSRSVELVTADPMGNLAVLPAYTVLMSCLTEAGRIDEALQLAPLVERLAAESMVDLDRGDAYWAIGLAHDADDDPTSAMARYEEARGHFPAQRALRRYGRIRLRYARTALVLDAVPSDVEPLLGEARAAFTILADPVMLAQTDVLLGAHASKAGRWQEALDLIGPHEAELAHAPEGIGPVGYRALAEASLALGDHAAAAHWYQQAADA